MDAQSGKNRALAECLEELGWPPSMLARKINRTFGAGTVSPSTPYHWVHTGGVPRPPLPTLTAHVLARHLGRAVSVRDLWQGRAADSPLLLAADTGMDVPWSTESALQILEDWLLGGLMDRRTFLVVSGASLSGLAREYLGLEPARVLGAIDGDGAGTALITQLETAIPALWALDDARGGARVLPYVNSQFHTAVHLLRQGDHNTQLTRQLFHVAAKLGQHAGWAAFDAGRHGLAQRYYLTALRAAHQAGDRHLAVHVLADLAFQAASIDARQDAGELAAVAMRAAAATPARVRASVASRAAFAYGAAGDLNEFAVCRDFAHEQLEQSQPRDGEPDWTYYLTPGHIDALAGSALVRLAQTAKAQGQTHRARSWLRDAVELLRGGAVLHDTKHPHQRRAAVEGGWLMLAHTRYGDLDQACEIGRLTVSRLGTVQSDRCTSVLTAVRGELRSGRMNNADVRAFVGELDRALSMRPPRRGQGAYANGRAG
jgi:hypothetical protein